MPARWSSVPMAPSMRRTRPDRRAVAKAPMAASRPVLAKPPRVRHGHDHQVFRLELAQAAAQAVGLAEFDDSIRTTGTRPQKYGDRVPAMALELARRAV